MNARFDGRGYLPDPRDPVRHAAAGAVRRGARRRHAAQLTAQGVNVQAPSWRPDSGALVFTRTCSSATSTSTSAPTSSPSSLDGALDAAHRRRLRSRAPIWAADGSICRCAQQSLNDVIAKKQTFGSPTDIYRFPAGGGAPVEPHRGVGPASRPAAHRAPRGACVQFTAGVGGCHAPVPRAARGRRPWSR